MPVGTLVCSLPVRTGFPKAILQRSPCVEWLIGHQVGPEALQECGDQCRVGQSKLSLETLQAKVVPAYKLLLLGLHAVYRLLSRRHWKNHDLQIFLAS